MKHNNYDISEAEFGASMGISHLLIDKTETLNITHHCHHKYQHNRSLRLKKNALSLSSKRKFNWHFYIQCFCKAPRNLLSKITAHVRRKK